jgi:hypothetical protein
MSDAPVGTKASEQVDKNVVPQGATEQNPDARIWVEKFSQVPGLDSCEDISKLVTQMKGEYFKLMPEITDGFRATIWALRSSSGERLWFSHFATP